MKVFCKGALCALSLALCALPAYGQGGGYYAPASNGCTTCNQAPGVSYGQPPIGGGAGCTSCSGDVMEYSDASCGSGGLRGRMAGMFSSSWAGQGGCYFGGVGGLIMTRDRDDRLLLTFNGDERYALTSRDADFDYAGGFEAFAGRYLRGGRSAIEARYWGLFPNTETASAFGANQPGGIFSFPQFNDMEIDGGAGATPVIAFFDGAEVHRVTRSYEVHNVEANFITLIGAGVLPGGLYGGGGYGAGCSGGYAGGDACASCGGGGCADCGGCGMSCGCGPAPSRLSMTWLMGARYLRFDDGLTFASSPNDLVFTDPEDIFYNANTVNNLVGFQLGGRGYYALGCRTSLYSGFKAGVFGNHITQHQSVTSAAGQVATVTAGPDAGADFDINTDKDDVAFLGELDLGVNYRLTSCWNVNVGYRAVGLSGVALATSQMPRTFWDNLDEAREINSNGSLILHGGYLGMSCNY